MNTSLSIKHWAEDDRPREKMLLKGKSALSDAELLAILIGSGTPSKSALEIGQELLRSCNNDLNALGKLPIPQLRSIKGIGVAKAITLSASFELGRRRAKCLPKENPKITCSSDAYRLISPDLMDLPHEEFHAIYLSRSNQVLSKKQLSIGGIHGTVADGKLLFKEALLLNATGIIIAHNHPSGAVSPSQADIDLTKRFKSFGELVEISILDHLIIGNSTYFSFADESML